MGNRKFLCNICSSLRNVFHLNLWSSIDSRLRLFWCCDENEITSSNIPHPDTYTSRYEINIYLAIKYPTYIFSPTRPHWAELVVELPCPCVWMCAPSGAVFKESALGRFFHRVAMSVCLFVCLSPSHAIFFEVSHWPLDHMTRSRPLIGQPSFPTISWWWGV